MARGVRLTGFIPTMKMFGIVAVSLIIINKVFPLVPVIGQQFKDFLTS
ncbi:MAG: hypothetical protein ACYS1A_16885 [Planctomycetota bacterium]|jgi:hypothetical protein